MDGVWMRQQPLPSLLPRGVLRPTPSQTREVSKKLSKLFHLRPHIKYLDTYIKY